MTLLAEIEASAVESKVPIADLLRRCKILAARLKHRDFAAWVSSELNGYDKDAPLPSYRRVNASHSLGHFVSPYGQEARNHAFPTSVFSKPIRDLTERPIPFPHPISEIEQMATAEDLVWKWPPEAVALARSEREIFTGMALVDARRLIPSSALKGMLDTVRTRVLDFVLAIQAENANAGEAKAGGEPPVPLGTVTNIFTTTISGGIAVIGTSGGTASIGDNAMATADTTHHGTVDKDEKLQQLLAELRTAAEKAPVEERAEAVDQVKKVETQLAKPKPDLDRVKSYLAILQSIVTVATPAAHALQEYLPQIEHLLR